MEKRAGTATPQQGDMEFLDPDAIPPVRRSRGHHHINMERCKRDCGRLAKVRFGSGTWEAGSMRS